MQEENNLSIKFNTALSTYQFKKKTIKKREDKKYLDTAVDVYTPTVR